MAHPYIAAIGGGTVLGVIIAAVAMVYLAGMTDTTAGF